MGRLLRASLACLVLASACDTTRVDDAGLDDAAVNADAAELDGGGCAPFVEPAPVAGGTCAEEPLPTTPLAPLVEVVEGVEIRRNVFTVMRGGFALQADLHMPARTASTGALVVVHGGGWLDCTNRRDDTSALAHLFASVTGVPTFNVEYRLTQEGGGYPENLMDVKCAVQWLRDEAVALDIDPDRIGILGTSAGAHLALMVALTEHREDLNPGCGSAPPAVQLTLSYAGPTDLPVLSESSSLAAEAPSLYTGEACDAPVDGCLPGRGCTRCTDASPLSHACRAGPDPIVLLQAPDPYDVLVAQAQAERLADALTANGADVTLVIPSDEAMRNAGCTPEGGSHAADPCLLMATGSVVSAAIEAALGP